MWKFPFFVCFFLLSLGSSHAANTHRFTLNNGLKLIVRPVDRPGLVAMIWYKVGSADEPGGITGISHALEHMMFKGTSHFAPNSYSKIIAENGGKDNAMTSTDFTAYFAKLSATQLPTFLKLEADRMTQLTLDKKEFLKEIKVVQEERRMRTENNPQALTYEKLMATSHVASPYHHPTVGWMDDLENMQIEDLKKWYRKWYTPNNATIVLVGNITPEKALSEVKTYFQSIKSQQLPPRKPQRVPPNIGKREIELTHAAKLPLIGLSFNVPSVVTANKKWLPYALDVLAGILNGGDSARLDKKLIRGRHIASQISISYDLYARYDSLFVLFAIPSDPSQVQALRQAILEEIKTLKTTLVSNVELRRIKNQVIAHKSFEKDSLFGQAMALGELEILGLGHKEMDNYFKKIEAVTAAEVQLAAKLLLTPERMTVATLMPASIGSQS
jgi:zinc protease